MQTLERIEAEVKQLSATEQEALRDWLEHLLEDRLELKCEFKAEIEAGVKDLITVGNRRDVYKTPLN